MCGGCEYHQFPYEAIPPIIIDGKRKSITFDCKEDVWDIVDLLIEEVYEFNKRGKGFDVGQSINVQLPFFTCINHLRDSGIEKDISRYMYCKEFNVPPFKGSYGDQPALWSYKAFIIKNALAKKEKSTIDKIKKENK